MLFYDGVGVRHDIIRNLILELEKMLVWMRSQARYHFYCTSLLVVFDSDCPMHMHTAGHEPTEPIPPSETPICTEIGSILDISTADIQTSDIQTSEVEKVVTAETVVTERCIDIGDRGTLDQLQRHLAVAAAPPPLVRVKMIDFAHAVRTDNLVPDEGYIWGLKSLIGSLREVLYATPTDGTTPMALEVQSNILSMIERANIS
jgi:hypothetical protein